MLEPRPKARIVISITPSGTLVRGAFERVGFFDWPATCNRFGGYMSNDTSVYDLGELRLEAEAARSVHRPVARPRFTSSERPSARASRAGLHGTLSLFVPGAGHLCRRDLRTGLFFLSMLGFLAAFGWAMVDGLSRLSQTLELFGFPRAAGFGTLLAIYGSAMILHVSNVLSAASPEFGARATHPLVAGAASTLVPGWGQVLNGNRVRAGFFLMSLWLIAGAWLLAAPVTERLLDSVGLYIPPVLTHLYSAPVRWASMAVVWALAIYDAAATAAHLRGRA